MQKIRRRPANCSRSSGRRVNEQQWVGGFVELTGFNIIQAVCSKTELLMEIGFDSETEGFV